MSEKELRELDAFIAEHVMGLVEKPAGRCTVADEDFCVHDRVLIFHGEKHCLEPFHPTTDPAAAMEVLKKCAVRTPRVQVSTYGRNWVVSCNELSSPIKAETIELAICLFAKALFSK